MESNTMKLTQLNDLIQEFLLSKPLKPNSKRAYETDLFFFVQFYAAEKFAFEDLTQSKLLSWLKQYPPRAANRRGTNIRKFLLWLSSAKKIKIHPEISLAWKFQDPTPKKPDRSVDLNDGEINKLVNSKSLNLTKRVLLALVIGTGATLEELSALCWEDLNLGKLAHAAIGEAGRARVIPLEKTATDLLKELKRKSTEDNPFVFTTDRGESINGAYMAIMVRRATLKVLDQEISPTQLHELAKKRLFKKYQQFDVTLQMLGKKKAVSLVRLNEEKIDLKRLKGIHAKAFE
jgi:site-specific recombinase XerD